MPTVNKGQRLSRENLKIMFMSLSYGESEVLVSALAQYFIKADQINFRTILTKQTSSHAKYFE